MTPFYPSHPITPIESQKQLIMALRIETKILWEVSKAPGGSSLLWQPCSFFFLSSPHPRQAFFQFLSYIIQSASGNHLLHIRTSDHPSSLCLKGAPSPLTSSPSPTPPVHLDDYKSLCRYWSKCHFLREYLDD